MTVAGVVLLLLGLAGGLMVFVGVGGRAMLLANRMPLGLTGWGIIAAVGLALVILNRRPRD